MTLHISLIKTCLIFLISMLSLSLFGNGPVKEEIDKLNVQEFSDPKDPDSLKHQQKIEHLKEMLLFDISMDDFSNPLGNVIANDNSIDAGYSFIVNEPTICYSVDDSGNRLKTILRASPHTVGDVGPTTGASAIEAVVMSLDGNIVYAANASTFGTLNLTSGAYTLIGSFGNCK